jgi:tripartite-type tricarboxylate transporter receptor subunit TctC
METVMKIIKNIGLNVRIISASALLTLISLANSNSIAQSSDFPTKPIKSIVTYPAGGSSDLMARIMGRKLSDFLGQPIIVENKNGAAGAIGMDYAAHQPGDGYSFVTGNLGPALVNPLLSKLSYNMDKDFIPVSLIATGPNVLVVNVNSPYQNLASLIEAGKLNPEQINFGSSGSGSMSHLCAEMIMRQANVKFTHVPYKGGGLAVNDLLAGQIDFLVSDALPVMQFLKAGKLRALAVTSSSRFASLPTVPTFTEAGTPGLVALNWWGFYLPKNTPNPIVSQYLNALNATMKDPEVKSQFANLGVDAVVTTPQEFKTFLASETVKYSKLIKDNNIKSE